MTRNLNFLTQRLYRRANGHRLMFWNAYNLNFTFRYFVGGSYFCVLNIQNSYTVVPEHRHVIGSDLSLLWTCANEAHGRAPDYNILNVDFGSEKDFCVRFTCSYWNERVEWYSFFFRVDGVFFGFGLCLPMCVYLCCNVKCEYAVFCSCSSGSGVLDCVVDTHTVCFFDMWAVEDEVGGEFVVGFVYGKRATDVIRFVCLVVWGRRKVFLWF